MEQRGLSEWVIGAGIEVHRTLGAGLLESVYLACLALELELAGIPSRRQVALPVRYKGLAVPLGFRADMIVAETIVVEVKAVPAILPVHEAQLLTYLRLSGLRVGLLMNFHAPRLKDGLKRLVL